MHSKVKVCYLYSLFPYKLPGKCRVLYFLKAITFCPVRWLLFVPGKFLAEFLSRKLAGVDCKDGAPCLNPGSEGNSRLIWSDGFEVTKDVSIPGLLGSEQEQGSRAGAANARRSLGLNSEQGRLCAIACLTRPVSCCCSAEFCQWWFGCSQRFGMTKWHGMDEARWVWLPLGPKPLLSV